jgi:peptidoglycan/LPS O-acetylase OafA/YrhL
MAVAGWLAAAFLVACLPFAKEEGPFVYWGGFIAIDVAVAILLLAILSGRWAGNHFLEFKPLVALGVVSYAFYLWHLPVFFGVRYFGTHWNNVVRVVVAIVATLSLTLLSWFLLERPLMRWSKRLEERRYTKPLVMPAVASYPSDRLAPSTSVDAPKAAGAAVPARSRPD